MTNLVTAYSAVPQILAAITLPAGVSTAYTCPPDSLATIGQASVANASDAPVAVTIRIARAGMDAHDVVPDGFVLGAHDTLPLGAVLPLALNPGDAILTKCAAGGVIDLVVSGIVHRS